MSYETPTSFEELLQRWHKRLRESQFTHYERATSLSSMNYYLGLPVVLLSTVVGTSVFASLSKNTTISPEVKLVIGLTSVVAAVLASLQTFLKFSERAEKHRSIGAKYGAIRREIEQLIVARESLQEDPRKILDNLRAQIDSLAAEAPEMSSRAFQKIQKKLGTTNDFS